MASYRLHSWLAFSSSFSVPVRHGFVRSTCPTPCHKQTGGRRLRPIHHIRSCVAQRRSSTADDLLRQSAQEQGLDVHRMDKLLHLADLLLSENKRYNLTAIRDRDAVLVKHIVDALSLLPVIDDEEPETIIDVGTGAGLPGIVLAIARPAWHVTLLDSVRKKTTFHDLVRSELMLDNIQSVWARAEDAGQNQQHREKYDVVIARSVAEMRVLCELCLPLLSVNGCFLAQKSVDASQSEILEAGKAMKTMGGRLESVLTAWPKEWNEHIAEDNPDTDGREKCIVSIRKDTKTPPKFPRSPGVPKKAPI